MGVAKCSLQTMKSKLLKLVLSCLVIGNSCLIAQTSITQLGITYTENFNTFEGTSDTVPAQVTFSGSDFTPGGFYNFDQAYNNSNSTYALRVSSDSTDYAFGEKGPTSGSRFVNWVFVNNTGAEISAFQISWDAVQYSAAGRATTITQNYNAGQGFVQTGLSGNVYTASVDSDTGGVQLSSIAG